MQAFWTLVRRELGAHFCSWTGYIVIACVVFLLGCSFNNLIVAMNSESTDRPVTEVFYSTYYFWLIVLIAAPVITMRSFAHEKYSGTFETLMTAPVSDLQVVLAKFTGAMLFYILMWLPLLGCLAIVRYYSHDRTLLDPGAVGTTFLGIFLLGAVYMSLGCLASAMTRNQIIAAMVSFAMGVALFLVSFISMTFSTQTGWEAQLFTHVGLIEHMRDFAHGIVDTRPLILYLSLTAMFLFFTHRVIESRRWK
ncbi:MAG TPA: ABC transporter permease subunit [Candidatus Binatia bacterium]|jgi:ABC-2 type transport system permease protein|nr:ABC transporter permease subunit [Candidatus Binatia bacterium]